MGKSKRLAADLARARKVGLDSSVLIYHLEGLAPYELPHTAIVAPHSAIAREAARLRASYKLRTPDALVLSTALAEEAKAFLTNDADLKRVHKEGLAILLLEDYL